MLTFVSEYDTNKANNSEQCKHLIVNLVENHIGDRIKTILKRHGVSQNEFARILGTSSSRISNIITGRNKPDSQMLAAIVKAYPTVDLEWLLIGSMSTKEKINYALMGPKTGLEQVGDALESSGTYTKKDSKNTFEISKGEISLQPTNLEEDSSMIPQQLAAYYKFLFEEQERQIESLQAQKQALINMLKAHERQRREEQQAAEAEKTD